MTPADVPEVRDRINRLWPTGSPLSMDQMLGYLDRLEDFDLAVVVHAVVSLSDDGGSRKPTPGELRKRCLEQGQRHDTPGAGCRCWVNGLRGCTAKHDPGWISRQKLRDQAVDIVEADERRGHRTNVSDYDGDLAWYIGAVLLGAGKSNWSRTAAMEQAS